MPRLPHVESSEFSFNISCRCINKDWFAIPLDDVWEIMSDHLYFLHHGYGFGIEQFVLMSNHYHLVTNAYEENLAEGMSYFQRETSRWLTRESGRINQCWGSRYTRTLITSNHYADHVYKYNYRNPVRAGICPNVEEYKYSTLAGLLGRRVLHFPVQADIRMFSGELEENLEWLNAKPAESSDEAIRRALMRRVFKLPKLKGKKMHPLEYDAL